MIMANGASDRDEYEVESEKLVEQSAHSDAQVIEPEQINNASIYRVYLSASNGIRKYRDTFRKAILNAGDLVTETCGEIDASKIMGRINVADAVVIAIDDKDIPIPNHSCSKCPLSGSCIKAKEKTTDACVSYVFEFEFRFARLCKKPVLFLVNQQGSFYISSDQRIVDYYNNLIPSEDLQKSIADFDNQEFIKSLYLGFRTPLAGKTVGLCVKNELEGDKLLRVLNKCVQLGSVPQTIGQYTITSGEMSANAGSEIHILTNEMYNYDFTAMSSLTIAINVARGVHYYYYGTSKDEETFNVFKQRIGNYLQTSLKAKNNVVAWIRQAKCDVKTFGEFLNIISINRTIRGIVGHLLMQCNQYDEKNATILQQCEEGCLKVKRTVTIDTPLNFDKTRLCDWISGKIFTDESKIYRLIENLSVLLKPLKNDLEISNKAFIKEFITKLEALNNMALLTRWQATPDDWEFVPSEEEKEQLIDYFKYKDRTIGGSVKANTIISEQIEEWIKTKEGEIIGVKNGEFVEQDIERHKSNIHFCLISDNNPYVLAYSFVLFLDYNPRNMGRDAAAWYTTYARSDNPSVDAIDNAILMVDIEATHNLYSEIQAVFRQLIVSNETALAELKKSKSNILQRLEIVEQ